jgi:hypothetical protein
VVAGKGWKELGMNVKLGCAVVLIASLLGSAPALADAPTANLQSVTGKVLLDQGHGYVRANPSTALKAGDRIFIGAKSSAILAFTECAVTLDKPMVFTLAAKAPCNAGRVTADIGGTFITPVRGTLVGGVGASAPAGVTTAVTIGFSALTIGATVNNLALPVSKP